VIHTDAIIHNFREVCRLAGSGSPIAPVIKSDAYGHGWVGVSTALAQAGADRFCVSLTEEGVKLRDVGCRTPILVLGGVYSNQARDIILKDLTVVITSLAMARALNEAAESLGRTANIHVKIDTGLGRLGILDEEVPAFFDSLKKLPWVHVEGICSSFSSISDLEFSERQFKIFERIAKQAELIYGKPLLCHIAHSGGLLRGLSRPGWLIRPGIMLYGYTRDLPTTEVNLKPVLTWKTAIFKVRAYPPGSPIGYGGKYKTKTGSRIALLPVGYTDGLFRSYAQKGEVLIRGTRAPIVGSPSMDWTMAEVGHIKNVMPEDEVILIGSQGNEQITADEMAERAGTIIDEVFVSIGKRIPRIYQSQVKASKESGI